VRSAESVRFRYRRYSPDERKDFFIAMNNVNVRTKGIAKLGVLAAVSIVLVAIIHFPIVPAASFLEYDPADVPILLGTFALGPFAGFVLTAIVAVIQGLTVSAASSWYGIIMHLLATGLYVIVAGNVYKKKKTKRNAIKALALGTLSMVAIMVPANIFLTPIYMDVLLGIPNGKDIVMGLLPSIVLFNVIKAGLNSVITFFVYKRISPILHK